MKRRLFTFFSIISLLLFLGCAGLWGWSLSHSGSIYWSDGHRSRMVHAGTSRGLIGVAFAPGFTTVPKGFQLEVRSSDQSELDDAGVRPVATRASRWGPFGYYFIDGF